MKQLNTEMNRRVIRDLAESGPLLQWLAESREQNRNELELISNPEEIARLQGENRAIKIILDKVPDS